MEASAVAAINIGSTVVLLIVVAFGLGCAAAGSVGVVPIELLWPRPLTGRAVRVICTVIVSKVCTVAAVSIGSLVGTTTVGRRIVPAAALGPGPSALAAVGLARA